MNNKLPIIKCAILDDDIELKSNISRLSFMGGEKLKIELDGVEFKFPNTFDQDWSSEAIKDYSIKHKIDFWIVDSRAINDDGEDTNYSFRVINALKELDKKYCVFTSDPSFKKTGQYKCKVFKKDASIDLAKAKDAETPFHGGLLEMIHFIKEQVGWGEFAPYVKFLDYTTNNYHGQLKTTMREISKSLTKVEDSIGSSNFEKESFSHLVKHTREFLEVLFVELKELGLIPYLEKLYSSDKSANIANCIKFLTDPNSVNSIDKIHKCEHLNFFKFKEGETKIYGSFYEIENHNGFYKLIDKSTGDEFAKLNIGKDMRSTFIGASLQFIIAFDNTNLHFSGFEDRSHSVRSFLEAFKFVCLRLNILFPAIDELLSSDNNAENYAEESVNKEVADESNSEEVIKETPTNEGTPEVATEEVISDEDANKNVEDVKEYKIHSNRKNGPKITILGNIDSYKKK
jgi:hypothetical protein